MQHEFDQAMAALGPFERKPHIAVAVSGGADSLALAVLADQWARARGGRITALTVDHGLRSTSAAEAGQVGNWLAERSISHEILVWQGPKPKTGLQAAARSARYTLLDAWCVHNSVIHLLLGHHRDDQAETVLIRILAGSGLDGLGAMAPIRETRNIRILRPLLDIPKSQLEGLLERADQPWSVDPSNENTSFKRVRVRSTLDSCARPSQAKWALADASVSFRAVTDCRRGAVAALIASAITVYPAGYAKVDSQKMREADGDIAVLALAAVFSSVGGMKWRRGLRRFQGILDEICEAPSYESAGSFSRCRFYREGESIIICRELRNLPKRQALMPGQWVMWDNRFAIKLEDRSTEQHQDNKLSLILVPVAADGWEYVVQDFPELRRSEIPYPARLVLPMFTRGSGKIEWIPHLLHKKNISLSAAGREISVIFHPYLNVSGYGYSLAAPN